MNLLYLSLDLYIIKNLKINKIVNRIKALIINYIFFYFQTLIFLFEILYIFIMFMWYDITITMHALCTEIYFNMNQWYH